MAYTNSKLTDYTKISPNSTNPRNHTIDRITPHCYVGQVYVGDMGAWFAKSQAQASCNYGIGKDGKVLLCVEEKNRSWCSSNRDNDNRAVTIECASDKNDPYAINEVVYLKLIKLMADICKRNGKTKILWFGDKEKTLAYEPKENEMIITVHRWFANKACPGDYIYNRLGKIANAVNVLLGNVNDADGMSGKPSSKEEYIQAVGNICKSLYARTKILPSVITAQCCLETGFGLGDDAKVLVDVNNLLGMKTDLINNTWSQYSVWSGESIYKMTTEYQNGVPIKVYDKFRKYKDYEQCITDYEMFLSHVQNDKGYKYNKVIGLTDAAEVIKIIVHSQNGTSGYCTDPNYENKILNLIAQYQLQKFDSDVEISEEDKEPLSIEYYVRKSWKDKDSQLGAYMILNNAVNAVVEHWQYNVYDKTGQEVFNGTKALIDRACEFGVNIADDNYHGYNNSGNGWGPDEYNCIGLVMRSYKAAGLDPGYCSIQYMPEYLTRAGFKDVTSKVNLNTGEGLVKGDVLWMMYDDGHGHTELYLGNGKVVGARGDYDGKAGDSSGNEILVTAYSNMNWKMVFRLPQTHVDVTPTPTPKPEPSTVNYIVQCGLFTFKLNANRLVSKLKKAGFDALVKKDGNQYKVQAGVFTHKSNAEVLVKRLKAAGFNAIIKEQK